jgi:hypothetical protein
MSETLSDSRVQQLIMEEAPEWATRVSGITLGQRFLRLNSHFPNSSLMIDIERL